MTREFWILDFGLRIGGRAPALGRSASKNRSKILPSEATHLPAARRGITNPKSKIRRAFSLIEVVAALALTGVLAVFLWPLWNSSLIGTIETSDQLASAYTLRSEMETWIHLSKTTYQNQFNDLPILIDAYFQNTPNITVAESQWIEFAESPANVLNETASTEPTDYLRISLQHNTGQRLTFLFSRFEP